MLSKKELADAKVAQVRAALALSLPSNVGRRWEVHVRPVRGGLTKVTIRSRIKEGVPAEGAPEESPV